MSFFAVLLVLASSFLHALKSFFIKQSSDKQIFLWCYVTTGLLLYFPVFVFFAMREQLLLSEIFLWCALSGVIHFLYQIFFSRAYETGDLSHVYPIMRSSPALVLLVAVLFLEEEVTAQGVLGIVLILCGIYTINAKQIAFHDFLLPIRSLFTDRAARYALLTMFSVAAYSIVDKLGAKELHPFIFSYLLSVFTHTLYTPWVFGHKKLSSVKTEWLKNKKSILINGVIAQGGYLLIIIAFTFEKVSYVAGFRQLSIVFAVLMGNHLLKEEGKYIRLFAAVLIFLGAFIIAASG